MKVFYPAFLPGNATQRIYVTPANDGGSEVSEFVDGNNVPIPFTVEFKGNRGTEVSDALGRYLVARGHARRTRVPAMIDALT